MLYQVSLIEPFAHWRSPMDMIFQGRFDKGIPGVAAVIDDIVVGFEDAVREPVVAHVLPNIFNRIELGAFRRQGENGDVGGNEQSC